MNVTWLTHLYSLVLISMGIWQGIEKWWRGWRTLGPRWLPWKRDHPFMWALHLFHNIKRISGKCVVCLTLFYSAFQGRVNQLVMSSGEWLVSKEKGSPRQRNGGGEKEGTPLHSKLWSKRKIRRPWCLEVCWKAQLNFKCFFSPNCLAILKKYLLLPSAI